MKKNILAAFAILVIFSFVQPQREADHVFKQLHALEGKWIMKTSRGSIGEEWEKINDDHLQNKGFFIKGIDTIITERVSLKNTSTGIFYTSTVEDQNNKQPISFQLTASETNRFIFENFQHDFPKRIIYELISKDSIHAYIDGGANATGKRQDFYYRKIK